jgi:DNA repair photolyase
MVGVDVGPDGVSGAKLYFTAEPLSLDAAWRAGSPIVQDLRAAGLTALRDALVIHRLGGGEDAGRGAPPEVDFGLARNEIPWRVLRALPAFAAARPRGLDALEARFRLAVRRISFSPRRADTLTAYYVLAEHDPEPSAQPIAASGGPEAARPRRLPVHARGLRGDEPRYAPNPPVRVRRRVDEVARRLLGPLLEARPGASGWRVVAWDAEQGISLVFGRGGRFVLVELEARDEAVDCYARTRLLQVCARSQFTADGALGAEERSLVDALVRFIRAREDQIEIDARPTRTGSEVREIVVDRVLIPEGAGRYYLNPYAGCMVGCSFCYVAPRAELSRRLEGAPPPAWGRWVDVKINAPEILAREVRAHPPGLVRISPILTDPYQPIERTYRITRRCLDVLLDAGFSAAILTRESRALDDLELLARSPKTAVGFSIPTDDERLRRAFEPGSDRLENRFRALRAFAEAGVATCIVVQPALPMDVEAFLARVVPWVKAARVDGMHFGERVKDRYQAAGIADAALPERQAELVERLRDGFARAGVRVDDTDDLAGILESLMG